MSSVDRAVLLAIPTAPVPDSDVEQAARASGLDPYRTAVLLRARGVVALGSGDAEKLELAQRKLSEAGVSCAVVPMSEVRGLAPTQVAGGIAADDAGVTLRVHGRPFGPPPGRPLLLLFADLARAAPTSPAEHPMDSLPQRIRRASYPVVELIWREGRLRVAPQAMSWRGFPQATFSSPNNLIHLLELLTARSGGVTCDFQFDGQEMGMEPAAVASEALEGADRERLALFERFSVAAALAWNRDLYPAAAAGQLTSVGVASAFPGASRPAFSAAAPAVSPIPWIRKEKASRLRLGLFPWIILGPIYAIHVSSSAGVAAAALAVCGAASVVVAGVGLRLRERLRSVPLSRVRSLAMGPVGLMGRVVPCASLKVPYSMTVCAWYRFELQEQRGDDSERNYRTILSGSSGDLPFRLEDETGRVLVQPADAEIDVEPSTMPLGLGQRLREWVLEGGESIYVAGVAQRRSPLEDEHRLLSERLSALKHDPAAMTRLGVVGDDAVEAWDRVRADVERQVLAELSARESEEDDVFVGSAPGQPFLIASRSRRDQTRRLTWQFAAGAALGIAYLLAALLLVTIV